MSDATEVTHEQFWRMIAPSFMAKVEEEDALAILKCTAVILFTDNYIYLRLSSKLKSNVPRTAWPAGEKQDILKEECKPALAKYKKGSNEPPVGFAEDTVWSNNLYKQLADGEITAPPRTATIRGDSLFGGRSTVEVPPILLHSEETRKQVKREKWSSFQKRLASGPPMTIDLESDSEERSSKRGKHAGTGQASPSSGVALSKNANAVAGQSSSNSSSMPGPSHTPNPNLGCNPADEAEVEQDVFGRSLESM